MSTLGEPSLAPVTNTYSPSCKVYLPVFLISSLTLVVPLVPVIPFLNIQYIK